MAVTYERVRGETLIFQALDPDAEAGDESKIVAKMALLEEGARVLVSDSTASVAQLTVAFRDETDDVPKGWTFDLAASASAQLFGNRRYQLDSKRTDGAVVTAFPAAIVLLREPAFT